MGGLGVTGGDDTDTELVEAVVSGGAGLDWWVHTSETGAIGTTGGRAGGTWAGGRTLAGGTVGGPDLTTPGEPALSLTICDCVQQHTQTSGKSGTSTQC